MALALFAAASALSLNTHVIALFWIAPTCLLLPAAASRSASPAIKREVVAILAIMALVMLPAALRLAYQLSLPSHFTWLEQASARGFARTLSAAFLPAGWWDNDLVEHWSGFSVEQVGIPLAILMWIATFALLFWRRRALASNIDSYRMPVLIITLYLAVPLIIWLFGSVAQPIFLKRTISFAIPGAILFLVALVRMTNEPRKRRAGAVMAVVAYAISTLLHGTVREKKDWRGAYASLAAHVRPGDLVLVCPLWKLPAFRQASPRPAPAPIAGVEDGGLLVLENPLGAKADWKSHYFHLLELEPRPAQSPPPSARLESGRSLWLIDSDCSASDRETVRQWSAIGWRPALVWSSGRRGNARVDIWRYGPAA